MFVLCDTMLPSTVSSHAVIAGLVGWYTNECIEGWTLFSFNFNVQRRRSGEIFCRARAIQVIQLKIDRSLAVWLLRLVRIFKARDKERANRIRSHNDESERVTDRESFALIFILCTLIRESDWSDAMPPLHFAEFSSNTIYAYSNSFLLLHNIFYSFFFCSSSFLLFYTVPFTNLICLQTNTVLSVSLCARAYSMFGERFSIVSSIIFWARSVE